MKTRVRITVLLLMRCLLFLIGGWMLAVFLQSSLQDTVKWWSILCCVCNGITLFVLFRLNRKEGITYGGRIRYQKGTNQHSQILLGILVVLALGMSGMMFAGFLVYREFPYLPVDLVASIPIGFAAVNLAVLPLTTTLAEDGLYLGLGVNSFKNRWSGWLVPAFVYAFQHCFIPLMLDIEYMAYRFLSFLPLTLLICLWYQRKRNPLPIMAGHFLINFATAIQILIFSIR